MNRFIAQSRWVLLAALLVVFSFGGQFCSLAPAAAAAVVDEQSQDADAEFVFDVYNRLTANFYNPRDLRLRHPRLFNAALDGITAELQNRGIEFVPARIDESLTWNEVQVQFTAEFQRARELTSDIQGMDGNALAFAAATALLGSVGDSHTGFIPPDPLRTESGYSGIGTAIKKLEDGFYYFDRVFAGGPAERAGLQRFDRLIAVDGRPIGNDLREIISLIKGQRGTSVELTIERQGNQMQFTVMRDNITPPSSETRIIQNDGESFLYMRLYQFDFRGFTDIQRYITESRGISGIILDLRGNPGGQETILELVAELFLEEGTPIFTARERWGTTNYVTQGSPLTNAPVAVLVDDGSASASEVTAVALQEAHRATIVGTQSRGAVGVGIRFQLSHGAMMMVTVGEVFAPSGRPLEGDGVHPDAEVALTRENISEGQDTQLLQAIETLKQNPR